MKRPAFQFYPGDWQRDPALRSCSVAARGLWIEMICVMHQADPYGHLRINAKPIEPGTLGRMVGASQREVIDWLGELEAAGVFNREDDGGIVSRRMVRDEQTRIARAAGGKLGGNPNLMPNLPEDPEVTSKVRSKVNLDANLRPTPSSSSSSSSSVKPKAAASLLVDDAEKPASIAPAMNGARQIPKCPAAAVVAAYHDILPELPKVGRLTEARRAHIRQRWREWGAEKHWETAEDGLRDMREFFAWVRKSPFLMGKKKPVPPRTEPFVADIDFLMNAEAHVKVFEGRYHDSP